MNYPSQPATAGFGNCPSCAYVAVGPPMVCARCAVATMERPAFPCAVCGQRRATATAPCGNGLCSSPDRWFEYNRAIALKTGALERAIKAHKYPPPVPGWGVIFARVLLGYLAYDRDLATADMIIPMPGSPLPSGTPRAGHDHTGWVIESAIQQSLPDLRFPFRVDPPVIVKTTPTGSMVTAAGIGGRAARAVEIYQSLQVVDPSAVRGRSIVVFDDVFTTGSTLNVVARRLREAGAVRVRGLTMARQPWWG